VLVHVAVPLLLEPFIVLVIFNIGCLQRSSWVSFNFGLSDTSIIRTLREFQVRLLYVHAGTRS
jgi:hypothetical protein